MLVENNAYPEDVRVLHSARTLTEAGYLVSVICQSRPNRPPREVLAGVQIYRYALPVFGTGFVAYILEYSYSLLEMFLLSIRVWRESGFDIIHAANPPDTAVLIAAFYKILGKRFIFDQHDLSPEIYLLKFGNKNGIRGLIYWALLFLEGLSCRLADHIIAPNESYKVLEMDRDKVPPERITVVRNGPDLDKMAPAYPLPNIGREGRKTLLYLGVIGFQDGVDFLLRALHHLKYQLGRSDFLCVIAGDGDALPGLKMQAVELALGDFVLFPGWIESAEVPGYISTADICVAPEPSNDLNDRSTIVKIMEYMAAGNPIVAFDLPEHQVTAQNAAIYAEPNSELDFARKIAELMDDPQKCREMGQFGRERIEKELGWCYQKTHLLDAYNKIDGNRRTEVRP